MIIGDDYLVLKYYFDIITNSCKIYTFIYENLIILLIPINPVPLATFKY